jgi:hypothetical protein
VRAAIPKGNPVALTYPYPTTFTEISQQPMLWQMDSGYGFRLLGGYAHALGPNGADLVFPPRMDPPGLQRFLSGLPVYGPPVPVGPRLEAVTRTTLANYDVRVVIVDRYYDGSAAVMRLFRQVLGPPDVSSSQFSLWVVKHETQR